MTADETLRTHDGGAADPAGSGEFEDRVADLTAAYHRTVDHIMTNRYGPGWATRGDLPDDAYTAELIFSRWLSDLLDHIDHTALRISSEPASARADLPGEPAVVATLPPGSCVSRRLTSLA